MEGTCHLKLWEKSAISSILNNSRRKKKQYVHILEARVDELEAKVVHLTDQLRVYKSKVFALASGFERDYEDVQKTKAYYDDEFYEYLEKWKDKDQKLKKIKQLSDLHGPGGEDRKKMIKHLSKNLIHNLMPLQMRCFLDLFSECSKGVSDTEYSKLLKMNKVSALTKLKEGNYTKNDEIFYKAGVSSTTRNGVIGKSKEITKFKKTYTKLVSDIVRLRNRILKTQKDFHLTFWANNSWYDSTDYGRLFRYLSKISKEPQFCIHRVYDMKTRSLDSPDDEYESDVITDDDLLYY